MRVRDKIFLEKIVGFCSYVMAFSCMTVIGNAALVKSEVTWDNIDDAQLTAEQVADLALDMVDNDLS